MGQPKSESSPPAVVEVSSTETGTTFTCGAWSMTRFADQPEGEPLIRDIDAATRLGFARPRKIRDTIKRIWPENQRPNCRSTVERQSTGNGASREYTVQEFWLTEAQLLKVIARSETPIAEAILDDMIRVYMAVRRHLAAPVTQPQVDLRDVIASLTAALQGMREEFLAGIQAVREEFSLELRRIARSQRRATGNALGSKAARSEVLEPIVAIATRLAKVDPMRSKRAWVGRLHLDLRKQLGIAQDVKYQEISADYIPAIRAFVLDELEEVTRRERFAENGGVPRRSRARHVDPAQTDLPLHKKN